MKRAIAASAFGVAALFAASGRATELDAQQVLAPQVQNGEVQHVSAGTVEEGLARAGSNGTVWVGWTVPMVAGTRDLCNWYSNAQTSVRGFLADAGDARTEAPPEIAPATGPVPLEAGMGLVVLVRLVDGRQERLRTLSDDCPIDAGGRSVVWLDGINASASLAYLAGLDDTDAALSAVSLHRDDGATEILERLATEGTDTVRRRAASRLATFRGAAGFAILTRLVASETDEEMRRSLVSALGRTRQPGTADALLDLARNDQDATLRGEAAYHYARVAGEAGVPQTLGLIASDPDDQVKQRATAGIATLPDASGIPHLITLARSSENLAVAKQAVRAIGRSDDPRARAFLEEIVRR